MAEASNSEVISTKCRRIAELAKEDPQRVFTSLAHFIDLDWLREAYRRTRKNGATGVDRQTAEQYAAKLDENLASLLDRAKSGRYRAPPVKRVHIPKGNDGATRPIGIPTFEDKVLQRAVVMVLECVYEQDFLPCSHGFRPGRSALGASLAVREVLANWRGGIVVELDIQKFFDTLDHKQLRDFLGLRVRDGVLLRLIGKWLNAGVMEAGAVTRSELGTPQGGVISPLLANLYLHHVLDKWFAEEVVPRLYGAAELVRYADDAVIVCRRLDDAERLMAVLPKRFSKFGLKLHPEKTKLVRFERPALVQGKRDDDSDGEGPGSFDFLGFTYHWRRSRQGNWVVSRKTAKDRLARAIGRVAAWCKLNRHEPLGQQHAALCRKMQGHYAYYGVTGNNRSLACFAYEVKYAWRNWLARRSGHAKRTWEWFHQLLRRLPLPNPRIVHKATW
jgi:RNA-directed DNA polymerase